MKHVRPIWQAHAHRRLVEPFSGGLAITPAMNPERALLNDINPHTINFYRWLAAGLLVDLPMDNDAELFYAHRQRFNRLIADGQANGPEAAALFYYLNRTGYNGLCRFNRRGEFNVPFGKYARIRYTSDFSAYAPVFARWEYTAGDFVDMALDPADFIYADPPYDVDFRQYTKEGFGWADQVRLAQWLALHPGPVVLSNQATPRIVKLYTELGFRLVELDAPRMISSNGDRTHTVEVLATRGL